MKRLTLIILALIISVLISDAQQPIKVRVKDKQTEVSPSASNYLLLDRDDYSNYKKVNLNALKNYVNSGVSLSSIAGINTSGWQPGQILKFNNSGILVPVNMPDGGGSGSYVQAGDGIEVVQSSPTSQEVSLKPSNLQTVEGNTPAANLYFVVDASGQARRIPFSILQSMFADTTHVYLQISQHESIFLKTNDFSNYQYRDLQVWTVDAQGNEITDLLHNSDLNITATGCSAAVYNINANKATLEVSNITDGATLKITHLPSGSYTIWSAIVWGGPATGGSGQVGGLGDNAVTLSSENISDNAITVDKLSASLENRLLRDDVQEGQTPKWNSVTRQWDYVALQCCEPGGGESETDPVFVAWKGTYSGTANTMDDDIQENEGRVTGLENTKLDKGNYSGNAQNLKSDIDALEQQISSLSAGQSAQEGEGIRVVQSSPNTQEINFDANKLQTEDNPVAANLYFITDASGNSRRVSYTKVKELLGDNEQLFMFINKHESIFMYSDDFNNYIYNDLYIKIVDEQGHDAAVTLQVSDIALNATGCTTSVASVSGNRANLRVSNITDGATLKITHTPSGAYQEWSAIVWGGPATGGGLGDNAVTLKSYHISQRAITRDKIATGAVSDIELQDEAVTTPKIENECITNEKIENKTISESKLTEEVQQSLIKVVTEWPVYNALKPPKGFFFKAGEGIRHYSTSTTIQGCNWSYEEFNSDNSVCPNPGNGNGNHTGKK